MTTTLGPRFWEKVRIEAAGCWTWTAFRCVGGYGRYTFDGKTRLVHRFAYEVLVGPIPDGLTLDHLCRNPACCNPAHLEPVTMRENVLRGGTVAARNAAVTHCPSGHPYDAENTRTHKGKRYCRACRRARSAERRPCPVCGVGVQVRSRARHLRTHTK